MTDYAIGLSIGGGTYGDKYCSEKRDELPFKMLFSNSEPCWGEAIKFETLLSHYGLEN